jgi:hypothetical protein
MKVHTTTKEDTTMIKKRTKDVYCIYGKDFDTEKDALDYAYNVAYQHLDTLLKDLGKIVADHAKDYDIITYHKQSIHNLGKAIQDYQRLYIELDRFNYTIHETVAEREG